MPTRNFLDTEALQKIFARSTYISNLNLTVLSIDHDSMLLSLRMPMSEAVERLTGRQQFHGGAIAALIDITGDFAVGMMVGGGVPTINLHIDYLRPAIGDYLDAHGRVRRLGRSVGVVDIDINAPDGQLVAIGRGAYVPRTG